MSYYRKRCPLRGFEHLTLDNGGGSVLFYHENVIRGGEELWRVQPLSGTPQYSQIPEPLFRAMVEAFNEGGTTAAWKAYHEATP